MPKDKSEDKRRYPRFDTQMQIYFHVPYDITTKVKYQKIDKNKKTVLSQKYSAVSRNISVEGLCFISEQKLQKGCLLYLEVYVPKANDPVCMEGEVRWSTNLEDFKGNKQFATGVKLITVNEIKVADTIYFDEEHKIAWSVVLESTLGKYRIIAKRKK